MFNQPVALCSPCCKNKILIEKVSEKNLPDTFVGKCETCTKVWEVSWSIHSWENGKAKTDIFWYS
jgi:predicted  nucleic acid-binding Zn ribbon protein